MTKEEESIVRAIWGDQDPIETTEEVAQVVEGVIAMAEVMAQKWDEGLTVAFDAPINLH